MRKTKPNSTLTENVDMEEEEVGDRRPMKTVISSQHIFVRLY